MYECGGVDVGPSDYIPAWATGQHDEHVTRWKQVLYFLFSAAVTKTGGWTTSLMHNARHQRSLRPPKKGYGCGCVTPPTKSPKYPMCPFQTAGSCCWPIQHPAFDRPGQVAIFRVGDLKSSSKRPPVRELNGNHSGSGLWGVWGEGADDRHAMARRCQLQQADRYSLSRR